MFYILIRTSSNTHPNPAWGRCSARVNHKLCTSGEGKVYQVKKEKIVTGGWRLFHSKREQVYQNT